MGREKLPKSDPDTKITMAFVNYPRAPYSCKPNQFKFRVLTRREEIYSAQLSLNSGKAREIFLIKYDTSSTAAQCKQMIVCIVEISILNLANFNF